MHSFKIENISFDHNVVKWKVYKGLDTLYGARPNKRDIQKYIQDTLAEKIINEQAAQVFVIKPMVSGGFTECEKIIHLAQEENIRTVITSSLETSIGREACLHIILSNEITEVCGLATGCLLSEDKALNPILSGKIGISESPGLGIDL